VLKKLSHPNVLRCNEVFRSNTNCYIITEICNGGDLESKLRREQYFCEADAEPFVLDTFKGLRYLSENHVIHRDIKVANIFLHNGIAKIADFGFAKFTNSNFKDINIGSPIYMSPEGFIDNVYGPKTDVWAFGIFIYELLHGKTPFSHCLNEADLRREIRTPISYTSMKAELSFEVKDAIVKCL
jgi:serine/threonine protein kinase